MKFVHGAAGMINTETHYVINFTVGAWFDKKWTSLLKVLGEWSEKLSDGYYSFIGDMFSAMTKLVTTFPLDILNNPNVYKMQGIFIGYSVLMMVFLSIIEGYKAILGINYTRITTLFGRTFIALIGAGLTVPALIWLLKCSNLAVEMIMGLSQHYFDVEMNAQMLVEGYANAESVNFISSLLFMTAFFYFIVQTMFKVGIRWFDLLMNVVASPFAWGAYITDGTANHLGRWVSSTGKLILINIVYAFYVIVMTVVVMAPGPIETFGGLTGRMLLIIGGLYRMANPPAWIQGMETKASIGPRFKRMFFRGRGPKVAT